MPARILIIEDNPANLELMRFLLRAFQHTVLIASDGWAGVIAAQEHLPDLILCDVQLPLLDGYGVLQALRQDSSFAHVPIIAVTALAMVGDRDKMLAAGFDGYLPKPISPETFVNEIDVFLAPQLRSGLPNRM